MSSRGLFSNMFTVTTYNKIYVQNHSLKIETVYFVNRQTFQLSHSQHFIIMFHNN